MLVAPPRDGGAVATRTFIPHRVPRLDRRARRGQRRDRGLLPGTVARAWRRFAKSGRKRLSVEHPTGEFTVELTLGGPSAAPEVTSAALLRTARWLFDGAVGIPAAVWQEAT